MLHCTVRWNGSNEDNHTQGHGVKLHWVWFTVAYTFIFTFTFTYPLTARVVGVPQMTSQPVSSIFFSVLHCLLGRGELETCPFPDVVFPPLPVSALPSSPFHCALQDGFGQTWWKGDMSIPLQRRGKWTLKCNQHSSDQHINSALHCSSLHGNIPKHRRLSPRDECKTKVAWAMSVRPFCPSIVFETRAHILAGRTQLSRQQAESIHSFPCLPL